MISLALLLFSTTELENLKALPRHSTAPLPAVTPHGQAPTFMLQGIAYTDKQHWSFWINGQKFSPNTPSTTFKVKSVSSESVTLITNNGQKELTLYPHKRTRGSFSP